MNLDPDKPMLVLDTSAILELAGWVSAGRTRQLSDFSTEVGRIMGAQTQLIFHPVSISEIATNSHEEVLLGRKTTQKTSRSRIQSRHKLNEFALIALKQILTQGGSDLPTMHQFVPRTKDWTRLFLQRQDFRSLRCTDKNGVVPVASMVDHMILSLADSLRADGFHAGIATGDKEILGAAEELQVPRVNIHNLKKIDGYLWKSCKSDESCIGACREGEAVTDCDTQFQGMNRL